MFRWVLNKVLAEAGIRTRSLPAAQLLGSHNVDESFESDKSKHVFMFLDDVNKSTI